MRWRTGGSGTIRYSFHDVNDWFIHYHINAILVDSETGETVELTNKGVGTHEFMHQLKDYAPYGFGVSKLTEYYSSGQLYYYMLGVSQQSYKFLDMVKTVTAALKPGSEGTQEFIRWRNKAQMMYTVKGFIALDAASSLFRFDTNGLSDIDNYTPLCTLLEVMIMCPEWWYGDDYYILVDQTVYHAPLYYKVSFYDVKKVKGYVAKSALLSNSHLRGVAKRRLGE